MNSDRSDLVQRVGWYLMVKVAPTLFSLSRPGTIGQDEVESITCTTFLVVLKANELTNRPCLEPLFKERGFIEKLKQGSAVWIWANNL